MRPRPVAVLAVLESVFFGLVTRHAYDEGLPAAVPLTFTLLLVVPMVAGYRTVTSGDADAGLLAPSAFLLMLLAAAVAQGWVAVLCLVILSPLLVMLALLGGALAALVRAVRRLIALLSHAVTSRGGAWTASLRRGPGTGVVRRAAAPGASGERVRDRGTSGAHPHAPVTIDQP